MAAVGLAMLFSVGWAIYVYGREDALDYLGFGIVVGLMLFAAGTTVAIPERDI
jgi:hypothetical protein